MSIQSITAQSRPARQRGAVLFVALIFLLALTLLGVMLARTQTTEERMAQNDANHDLALESAGTTLRFAEANLADGTYTNFTQNGAGLYQLDPGNPPAYAWGQTSQVLTYAGPTLQSITTPPEFVVVQLPAVQKPGTPLGGCAGYGGNGCVEVFQITAHSYGGNDTGNATLQSIYQVE